MNITYFLGAGASKNAIPLLNGMESRMQLFYAYLKNWVQHNKTNSSLENYFGAFDDLFEEVDKSTSYDQYVKMLSKNDLPLAKHKLLSD